MGRIGPNTIIYNIHHSNIHASVSIGENCKIHSHVWIGKDVVIGNQCLIQAFAFIPEGVTIKDEVFVGPHVCFTNDKRPPSFGLHWAITLVKRGASIGANATILPGIVIGEKAVIGAGAVVTKDVPAGEVWVGNPAKLLVK